jgi:hypothetical protein
MPWVLFQNSGPPRREVWGKTTRTKHAPPAASKNRPFPISQVRPYQGETGVLPASPRVKRRPKIPPAMSRIPNESTKKLPSKFSFPCTLQLLFETRRCARKINIPSTTSPRLDRPALDSTVSIEAYGKSIAAIAKQQSDITGEIKRKTRYFPPAGRSGRKNKPSFGFRPLMSVTTPTPARLLPPSNRRSFSNPSGCHPPGPLR